MKRKVNRRAVLRGLSGVLISLPTLEGCTKLDGLVQAPARDTALATSSDALSTAKAKRFVGLMCPNGVYPPHWFPTGTERDFKLNLANSSLADIKANCIFTSGVHNKVALDYSKAGGNGHIEGVCSFLSGYKPVPLGGNNWKPAGGPSIDVALAQFHEKQGFLGRTRSMHFGEEGSGTYSGIAIQNNATYEDLTDIKVLFDSPGSATATALEKAKVRNKSILDGSMADYATLSKRVSGVDKQRLEAHLEALRSLEKRNAQLTACVGPKGGPPMNGDQVRDYYFDIVTAAFACDASRVATLVFHHSGGGGPTLPWVNVLEDIHELSHQVEADKPTQSAMDQFNRYHQWWSSKTVRFVNSLKNAPSEHGGSLFDETVIFQGSEIAHRHSTPNMPFLIVAGDKTPFDTGRYIQFPAPVMHTHLLTTLLNAFGDPTTQFGDPEYVSGNLNARLFKAA